MCIRDRIIWVLKHFAKWFLQILHPILVKISLVGNITILALIGHSFAIFFNLYEMVPTLRSLRVVVSYLFPHALGWWCFLSCLFLLLNFNRLIVVVCTWNIGIHVNRFFYFWTTSFLNLELDIYHPQINQKSLKK